MGHTGKQHINASMCTMQSTCAINLGPVVHCCEGGTVHMPFSEGEYVPLVPPVPTPMNSYIIYHMCTFATSDAECVFHHPVT